MEFAIGRILLKILKQRVGRHWKGETEQGPSGVERENKVGPAIQRSMDKI